eukprot:PLAT3296.12.p1 GENE.PLAT3296.12~~PLAT3296.12.p1  ORF type:complete len:299 (-),score=74.28 PLAT3296.12:620-1516(-)
MHMQLKLHGAFVVDDEARLSAAIRQFPDVFQSHSWEEEEDGELHQLSLRRYSLMLLYHAFKLQKGRGRVDILAGALFGLVQLLARAMTPGAPVFGTTAAQIAFVTLAGIVRLVTGAVLASFLGIARKDYRRRTQLMDLMALSTAGNLPMTYPKELHSCLDGIISLQHPHNIQLWLSARRLTLHSGRRMFLRLQLYVSTALGLLLAAVLWVATVVLFPQAAGDAVALSPAILLPVFYAMAYLTISLTLTLLQAVAANARARHHISLVVDEQAAVRVRLCQSTSEEVRMLVLPGHIAVAH